MELKSLRVSNGGNVERWGEGDKRRQSQAGQLWGLVSLVRASGLHPRARGDPGKHKSLRLWCGADYRVENQESAGGSPLEGKGLVGTEKRGSPNEDQTQGTGCL